MQHVTAFCKYHADIIWINFNQICGIRVANLKFQFFQIELHSKYLNVTILSVTISLTTQISQQLLAKPAAASASPT